MTDAVAWILAVPVAYLIGSVPVGIALGRFLRGVDVRKYGSGSSGATNVLRTLGPAAGALVLLADIAKGAAPVLITTLATDDAVVRSVAGLMVVVGHMWPVWARFRGGKGVATSIGVLIVLAPWAALPATAVGFLVLAATRIVSLSSMIGAAVGAITLIVLVAVGFYDLGYLVFAISAALLILLRHRSNIKRLLSGTENKIEEKARPRRVRTRQT
jgi:glycerol-3-phosphate acyltransferase PlsY